VVAPLPLVPDPPPISPYVLAQVLAAPEVRPEAVARGLVRLVVGPGPSDAVGEAIWNEGQEALKDLH
jgi:hypothetical protein